MGEAVSRRDEFSPADLDRVIRRAAELQFEDEEDRVGPRSLDEAEVLRIGGEVGIEGRHVRRAIGELRAEQLLPVPVRERGLLSKVVGPVHVRSYRVVPGTVEEISTRLDEHLRVAETLSPVRNRMGRSVWEPTRGVMADLRRGLHWKGYRYELARVSSLEVNLSPMEDGFVLVSLLSDLSRPRAENFGGWTTGLTLGFTGAALSLGIVVGAPLLAIPGALLGAFLGARVSRGGFRRVSERIGLTMEGLLDRLERGVDLATRPVRRLPRS